MTPFILLGRKKLPPESAPSGEDVYDELLQLWIDQKSGSPLVSTMQRLRQADTQNEAADDEDVALEASRFGETTSSRSREGADQTEGLTIQATKFGETTLTKAPEGADRIQISVLRGSKFGETTKTASGDEGADRPSTLTEQAIDAAHSHF